MSSETLEEEVERTQEDVQYIHVKKQNENKIINQFFLLPSKVHVPGTHLLYIALLFCAHICLVFQEVPPVSGSTTSYFSICHVSKFPSLTITSMIHSCSLLLLLLHHLVQPTDTPNHKTTRPPL